MKLTKERTSGMDTVPGHSASLTKFNIHIHISLQLKLNEHCRVKTLSAFNSFLVSKDFQILFRKVSVTCLRNRMVRADI